jgi:hypothetical protein
MMRRGAWSRLTVRDWWVATVTGFLVTGAVAGVVIGAGGWGSALAAGPAASPAPVVTSPPVTSPAADAAAGPSSAVGGPQPLPSGARVVATSVSIPAIGVRSTLQPLALDRTGALQPPRDPAQAGWYAAGPVPGDRGPAVIAGHLDSFTGPAVFLRLRQLRPGDVVVVHRSDGTTATFRVQSTRTYPKDAFPTQAVYGPTPVPVLRLITCGGAYDRSRQRYPDDVVVFAELVHP